MVSSAGYRFTPRFRQVEEGWGDVVSIVTVGEEATTTAVLANDTIACENCINATGYVGHCSGPNAGPAPVPPRGFSPNICDDAKRLVATRPC
jgi:hypothetical protein